MNIYDNILVTATNSLYYNSVLTLINSLHETTLGTIDQIYVYNLGLNATEISHLNKIKKVTVVEFPEKDKLLHPKFLEPKSYVYKIYCMHHAAKLGKHVLWMDSGACALQSIDIVYDKIKTNDIFLVGDTHKNRDYTHKNCIICTNATEEELNGMQIWAGLVGYKSKGKYQHIFDEAYRLSLIPGCLDGNQDNHRHDQSILSILAERHGCPRENIEIFGYWTDASRNIDTAKSVGAIIFAHRRGYHNISNLIYEC